DLAAALDQNGLKYDLQPGEGAFYGPKIEFTLKDSLGRLWQVGTIQLDFNLPVRLGAEFVDEDNTRKPPVMPQALKKQGFRVVSDLRNEKITYKIREHSMQRVPFQVVVGEKERQENKLAIRKRGGEDLGQMDLQAFVAKLRESE
ncbi:MAG: His/Gly/Thr/Pro-type tRNA ligase C-terminal domain-containing protein, partial [Thiobacillaceae bacterium]|nr:His/Gly/Thr/Pro-type tRNA ligase C-terminal domain-containing protein [Thiobacillaceae bacterium]